MLNGQKIVVVMPAYNAARTLRQTYEEVMAQGIVDLVIVVDDASQDETVAVARTLDRVEVEVHPMNRGYGANQKTCYRHALAAGGDIIIMIHPDYQYTPRLIPAMAALVASGVYPCVLASRILVDQLPKNRPLRIRLSRHRLSLPLGALGSRPSDCLKDGRCDGLWLQRAAPRLSYSTRGGHQSRLFDSDCQLSPFSIFDRQF